MTLTKRNERVLRGNNAPCPYCGADSSSVRFYEAWCDVDRRTVRIEQNYRTKTTPMGGSVSYGYVHSCYRKKLPSHFVKDIEGSWVRRDAKDTDRDAKDTDEETPPKEETVPAVQESKPVTGDLFANAMEAF